MCAQKLAAQCLQTWSYTDMHRYIFRDDGRTTIVIPVFSSSRAFYWKSISKGLRLHSSNHGEPHPYIRVLSSTTNKSIYKKKFLSNESRTGFELPCWNTLFLYSPFSGIAPCVGTTGKWYRRHTPTRPCSRALGLLVTMGRTSSSEVYWMKNWCLYKPSHHGWTNFNIYSISF